MSSLGGSAFGTAFFHSLQFEKTLAGGQRRCRLCRFLKTYPKGFIIINGAETRLLPTR